jgi:hypothetical protein
VSDFSASFVWIVNCTVPAVGTCGLISNVTPGEGSGEPGLTVTGPKTAWPSQSCQAGWARS